MIRNTQNELFSLEYCIEHGHGQCLYLIYYHQYHHHHSILFFLSKTKISIKIREKQNKCIVCTVYKKGSYPTKHYQLHTIVCQVSQLVHSLALFIYRKLRIVLGANKHANNCLWLPLLLLYLNTLRTNKPKKEKRIGLYFAIAFVFCFSVAFVTKKHTYMHRYKMQFIFAYCIRRFSLSIFMTTDGDDITVLLTHNITKFVCLFYYNYYYYF